MSQFKSLLKYISQIDEHLILSKEEEIELLKRVEYLEQHSILFSYLNQDIAQLLLQIPNISSSDVLSKFEELNFDDLNAMAKDISTPRKLKIYNQFIDFIYSEFSIQRKQTISIDNESLENLQSTQHKRILKQNKDLTQKLKSLFIKHSNFDYQKDLEEKMQRYNITSNFNYTKEPSKIGVKNFMLYFNQRLEYFTNLLSNRISLDNVIRIQRLKELQDTNTQVSIIGLVSDFQVTKNGHHIITIEDKSGAVKCFVNKDNTELIEKIKVLCLDEGIGIVGKVGKDIIWSDDIIIPSPPLAVELKKIEDEESYVVCISDLHIGAHVFQDEAFSKCIDFLNANTNNESLNEIASKIKYVMIPGDLIEGIGIYPGQGKDARILSTEKQYHEVAMWLNQIPKSIAIIMIPGNHDTNRLSEPQPPIPYEKAYAVYNLENALIFSNPSIVTIFNQDTSGGLECYSYHGGSYFYYAQEIQYLREKGGAKAPEEVVKFLLEKRHIAPSHGSTLYIPDTQEDPLIIKKMPDLFFTGHTHKLSLANYKGCTIVSGGCWVEMSDYQEKMGMFPDVGKCVLINAKTRKPKIINFYTEEHKRKK